MNNKILSAEKLIYKLRNLKKAFPRFKVLEKHFPKYVNELYKVQLKAR